METYHYSCSGKKRTAGLYPLVAGLLLSLNVSAQDQQSRLDFFIDEIDQLIATEEFDSAQSKLSELISRNIRDERIEVLNSRLRLSKSISDTSSLATAGLAITAQDQATVINLFNSLKLALENGEKQQVSEYSETSKETQQLLNALFDNYATIQISLSELEKDESSLSFFATLEFIQLKTASGDTAYPADAWKTHQLRVTKSKTGWRKVNW